MILPFHFIRHKVSTEFELGALELKTIELTTMTVPESMVQFRTKHREIFYFSRISFWSKTASPRLLLPANFCRRFDSRQSFLWSTCRSGWGSSSSAWPSWPGRWGRRTSRAASRSRHSRSLSPSASDKTVLLSIKRVRLLELRTSVTRLGNFL